MTLTWTGAGFIDLSASIPGIVTIKSPMDYGAAGDGTTNDYTAIQACATAIDAAGGGAMWIDRWYKTGSNLAITNKVALMGIGPTLCGFTAASFKTISVTGSPEGWRYTCENVGFSTVGLSFGNTASDYALGLRVANCTFDGCTTGVYIGSNVFMMLIDNCQFIDSSKGIYYDGVSGGALSGATMRVTNCGFFNSAPNSATQYGIYVDGDSSSNPVDFHIWGCHFEDIAEAGLYAYRCTNRHFLYLNDCHFERMAASHAAVTAGAFVVGTVYKITTVGTTNFVAIGASANTVNVVFTATGVGAGTGTATKYASYCVKNDGAIVWCESWWAWTSSVMWHNVSGRLTVTRGSANWQPNEFAKIDAGSIRVDASTMYTPNEYWGANYGGEFSQPLLVGDNPGSGQIVALRSPTMVRTAGYSSAMTNAAPNGYWKTTGTDWRLYTPGDGNDRVIEFAVNVTFIGTDNFLRVQLSDGITAPYVDAVFPLFVGVAHLRLVITRGGTMTLDGVYSGTTPAATTTKGIYNTVVENTSRSRYGYLLFQSQKFGATASSMQVFNITELVSGPYETAT